MPTSQSCADRSQKAISSGLLDDPDVLHQAARRDERRLRQKLHDGVVDFVGHDLAGAGRAPDSDDANAAFLESRFFDALGGLLAPIGRAEANVGDPALGFRPPFELGGRPHQDDRVALAREDGHSLFTIAADLRNVADIGDAGIPLRGDAADDEAVEALFRHLGADGAPAAIPFGQGKLVDAGFCHAGLRCEEWSGASAGPARGA